MIKKLLLPFSFLIFTVCFANAITIEEYQIRGVRPTDKISSLELNPSLTTIDDSGGISSSAFTAKYYYSFDQSYSIGVEVPVARFESPEKSTTGLGDILLSTSYTKPTKIANLDVGLDISIPTATDDLLGSSKLALNPFAVIEFSLSDNIFFATGYKHYASVTKEHSQEHTNMGRIRNMIGFTSNLNWWAIADTQYYMDYKNSKDEFYLEVELGAMLYNEISMYIKPGWRLGGNMQSKDWSLSFGVKLLSI